MFTRSSVHCVAKVQRAPSVGVRAAEHVEDLPRTHLLGGSRFGHS